MNITKEIEKLEEELRVFKIGKNPLLQAMKRDDWIIHVNNKAFTCWAGLHTLKLLKQKLGIGEWKKK